MDEITLFLTACGRPDLLKITLESFVKYNTYPIKECIIVEDSGILGINDFAKDILPFPCLILYNERRIGQMASMERAVPHIKTEWVFHCEEDWEFLDYGFIELSLKILKKNENILMVLLRSYQEYRERYRMTIVETSDQDYNLLFEGGQLVFSFNPGLRRKNIYNILYPYTKNIGDEGTIQKYLREHHSFCQTAVLKKNDGYVNHIGWGRHIW